MSRRTERVEVQLQREIAGILVRGDLRDPRLTRIESLSITGVRVSADLSSARVFFDVNAGEAEAAGIADALNTGTPRIRSLLAGRLDMRRVPALRFERDAAIERGVRMEALFADLELERRAAARAQASAEAGVDAVGDRRSVGRAVLDADVDAAGDPPAAAPADPPADPPAEHSRGAPGEPERSDEA
jgi:ribosome-binding factor A